MRARPARIDYPVLINNFYPALQDLDAVTGQFLFFGLFHTFRINASRHHASAIAFEDKQGRSVSIMQRVKGKSWSSSRAVQADIRALDVSGDCKVFVRKVAGKCQH